MIEYAKVESAIVNGLQTYLQGRLSKECPVIMANQVSPTPGYPYVSYTITSPLIHSTTHYSVSEDGTRYKPLKMVMSLTVQSDAHMEAVNIALQAFDYFTEIAKLELQDAGIVVSSVGGITNRDSLISIMYEYRCGFDITLLLMHTIEADLIDRGSIETVTIANNIEDQTVTKED